jgi:hypothetical protein
MNDILWQAKAYLDAGISVIPISWETKKPIVSWSQYQSSTPTKEEWRVWAKEKPQAIAVICGTVSGGREVIDFDDNSHLGDEYSACSMFERWIAKVSPWLEQYDIPYFKTGGMGYQVVYRCPDPAGNQKLAWVPSDVEGVGREIAIETRGEGGYHIVPPSKHPTGNLYMLMHGDPVKPPLIPQAVRDELIAAALQLDEMPYPMHELLAGLKVHQLEVDVRHRRDPVGGRVIDAYNEQSRIEEVLVKHGYTHAMGSRNRYVRPNGTSASVLVKPDDNVSFHWSTNDPLHKTNSGGKPLPRDPFDVMCTFEFNGDVRATVKAVAHQIGIPDSRVEIGSGSQLWAPEDGGEEKSPLNVPIESFKQGGWLEEYIGIMTEAVGSPAEFNELCGLGLIATALQGRARLCLSFGYIYPNIYGMIIARSSVYHKTSTLGKVREVLSRADMLNLVLSELMTPEGLLKELQSKRSGVLIRDEISTLLNAYRRRHLQDLKPDLAALYDCYPYSRRLSKEEIRVNRPYLSILGATTPSRFYSSVTSEDWQDGFLARWLFVLPQGEPNFDTLSSVSSTQYDRQMDQLASEIANLAKCDATDFVLEPEAFEYWSEWQREQSRNAYNYGDDVVAAITSRYSTYAFKFAMILAAINGSWGYINSNTMLMATTLADNFKASAHRLLSEKDRYAITGEAMQKIFRLILEHPDTGVTSKEIYQSLHMRRSEATLVLDKLLEIGAIRSEKAGNGRRFFAATDRLPIRTW